MIQNKCLTYILIALSLIITSCKKDWLDAKPDKSLVVPSTIADYQSILDNSSTFSSDLIKFNGFQGGLKELGAGDFYVTTANWSGADPVERNSYVWATEIFDQSSPGDWIYPYKRIYYANIVLDGSEKIKPANDNEQVAWRGVKGGALFFRAFNHYEIAEGFCKPYDKTTAFSDLGIPLRLNSNFNEPSVRSSVKKTYEQILSDLKQSADLVPVAVPTGTTPLYKLRPTKAAAFAMLARVSLAMNEYDSALVYSDKCLQLYNALMDYNTDPNITTGAPSIKRFNPEVLFQTEMVNYLLFRENRLIVDSTLFQMYDANDLRKSIFFRLVSNNVSFKGSYNLDLRNLFSGLATDEVYLIRAECNARKGNTALAIADLNTLYQKRWKNTVPYISITAIDANDALRKVLAERRKELCFRGLRWTDLRRLNKESQFQVTLKRVVNNQTYTLPPNDPKYVLPIPPGIVQLSGIQQNSR